MSEQNLVTITIDRKDVGFLIYMVERAVRLSPTAQRALDRIKAALSEPSTPLPKEASEVSETAKCRAFITIDGKRERCIRDPRAHGKKHDLPQHATNVRQFGAYRVGYIEWTDMRRSGGVR